MSILILVYLQKILFTPYIFFHDKLNRILNFTICLLIIVSSSLFYLQCYSFINNYITNDVFYLFLYKNKLNNIINILNDNIKLDNKPSKTDKKMGGFALFRELALLLFVCVNPF